MARDGREVWAKRVERLADSGLTLKEFAAEIGVNPNTLAGWRWRLGARRDHRRPPARPSAPAFLEIVRPVDEPKARAEPPHPGAAADSAEPFELVLRSGHRVRVPARFEAGALRRLVDALEAR